MGRESRRNSFDRPLSSRDVTDAFKRAIKEGDTVIMPNVGTVLWKVGGISLVMEPSAPPGMKRIDLVSTISFFVQQDHTREVILTIPAPETADAAAGTGSSLVLTDREVPNGEPEEPQS